MTKKKSEPLTIKELTAQAAAPPPCPLCGRERIALSDHHLVPKSRGGKVTKAICVDCHKAIHATFDNKELETTYNSVEALLAHPELAKVIAFIASQRGRVRTRPHRRRR
jgi:5-methylcytosine-specific restriction endonuclease McrA